MDDNNNSFDKDDALDCVMYGEVNKKKQDGSGKSGCFGIVALLMVPIVGVGYCLLKLISERTKEGLRARK